MTGITKINSSASDLLQWGKFACGPTFLGFDCVTLFFWVRVIVRICVEPASSSLETLNDKKSEQQHNGQSGDTADSHGSCSFSKGDFSRFKTFKVQSKVLGSKYAVKLFQSGRSGRF